MTNSDTGTEMVHVGVIAADIVARLEAERDRWIATRRVVEVVRVKRKAVRP